MRFVYLFVGLLGLVSGVHAQEPNAYQPQPAAQYTVESGYQFIAPDGLIMDVEHLGDGFIAVGAYGRILLSLDGQQWRQVPSPSRVLLNKIWVTPSDAGMWVVGHEQTILFSEDGGESWQLQHASNDPNSALYDIIRLDQQQLLAVGADGLLLRTTDAGQHWQAQEKTDSDDYFFTPTTMPADFGYHIDSITKLDDGTLLTTGEYGVMMRSLDNGTSWEMVASPYIGSLFGAISYGEQGAVVFGMRGHVFITESVVDLSVLDPEEFDYSDLELMTDAAELAAIGWRRLSTGSESSVYAANKIIYGQVLLLGDNGQIWLLQENPQQLVSIPLPSNYPAALSDAIHIDQETLLIAGKAGVTIKSFVWPEL